MTIAVAVKVHDEVVLAADSAASIMHPQGGPHGLVAWVYNNANKVFRLMREIWVGGVVWGAGSIGNVSISTRARDLTQRFRNGQDPLGVVPGSYTMQEVAENPGGSSLRRSIWRPTQPRQRHRSRPAEHRPRCLPRGRHPLCDGGLISHEIFPI
jgi:hypothetical protein